MKINLKFIFFSIILGAIFLRFFLTGTTPPSLNWDEASLGYNSYSVLKSGKDEWGRTFPITFEAFGDYKLPGYIYASVPFIALFGLNDFSIRLPSQIAGVLAVVLIYLIVLHITKDKYISLISSLLLTISPWHVFLSRVALEANLAFTFFLLALYLFFLGLKKWKYLILSSIFFGITIFTYNSARVFIPVFLLGLFFIYRKDLFKLKSNLIFPLIVLLIFIGIAGYLAIFQDSSSRYFWVAILDQGAINYLNESRNNSNLPFFITNLFYNRVSYFFINFISNYFKHFSLDFLYINGGSNYQFSIPQNGLIYLAELPFLLYGLYQIIKKKVWTFILLWLAIAPIPSALTREAPHVLRGIFMLGSLQIITAIGVLGMLKTFSKIRVFKFAVILLLIGAIFSNSFNYFYQYFYIYPMQYSQSWQFGMKQVYQYLNNNFASNEKIFITKKYGEMHIFYLFYNQYDPIKYQNNSTLVRYKKTNWRWVDRLDNLYFINDWEMKERLKNVSQAVVVTSPNNYPDNAKLLYSIYFLDGSKAFDVVKI